MSLAEAPQAVTIAKRSSTHETNPEVLALVIDMQSGTEEERLAAYGQMYEQYYLAALSTALRITGNYHDAEEVVSNVMYQILTKINSYSPEKGKFISWLLTNTHNRSVDKLRQHKSRPQQMPFDIEGFEHLLVCDGPEESGSDEEVRFDLITALVRLPEKQRDTIMVSYYGNMTDVETANFLGEPLGTIKTRKRLAMMKLKDYFEVSSSSGTTHQEVSG